MNIKPLADRVLIKPAPAEEKQPVASLFLTPLKKNLFKVKFWLPETEPRTKKWY